VNGDGLLANLGQIAPLPTFPGSINWSTKRIWPLGDSITEGVGGNSLTVSCGYRDVLSNSLIAAGFSGLQWVGSVTTGFNCVACPQNSREMLNDGHSGATVEDITILLPSIYPDADHPDSVLFMLGTNNLIKVLAGTQTMSDAIANYNTCLADLVALNPGMLFFVATVVPSPPLLTLLPTFNANIVAQIASYAGSGVLMYECDQFSALDPATDFDPGGIHPNQPPAGNGYPKMAAAWFHSMTTLTP
jgi:lysophospholipase L1-like esterase